MTDDLIAAAVLLRERHAQDERGIGVALANLLEAIGEAAWSADSIVRIRAAQVAAAVSRPRPDRESWVEYGYRLPDGVMTSGDWDDPWSMVADAMQASYDDGHEDAEIVQRTWVSGPWLPYVDEWAGVGPRHATVVGLPDGSVAVVHGDEPLSEEGLAATREVTAAALRLALDACRDAHTIVVEPHQWRCTCDTGHYSSVTEDLTAEAHAHLTDTIMSVFAAHLRAKADRMRAVLETITEPAMRIVADAAAMAIDSTALEIEYEVRRD